MQCLLASIGAETETLATCRQAMPDAERRPFTEAQLRVAIHVRRGDAAGERLTPLNETARRLRDVVAAAANAGEAYDAVLHSEGAQDAHIAELRGAMPGLRVQLNAPPLDAWLEMVNADVLVIARSTFSYSAGVYSEGVVVFERFWHTDKQAPDPKNWLNADRPDLRQALEEAIRRRRKHAMYT